MRESANVHSIEAVERFAAVLRQFGDEAQRILLGLDQQVNRALHWIDHDAPAYWQHQIRRSFDLVGETRVNLELCRLRNVGGQRASCIDEQRAFERAKRRLEESQAKLELVRQWAIRAHRAVDEYRGRIGSLKHHLDADVPRTLALLERTVNALDAYAQRTAPDADLGSRHAQPNSGAGNAGV